MYNYIARRLGFMVVTLFLVTLIAFAVTNVLPGNVALLILGPNASPASIHALKTQMGLNQPVFLRYLDWVSGLAVGDFGTSYTYSSPVLELIGEE